MSYGLIEKTSEDVPAELMEKHEITTEPVLYRGNNSKTDVARHFVETVSEISLKIEKLLKTNTPMIFTGEQRRTHESSQICNLCKINFSKENHKVADHCHLSGKLQTPNFVPIFFHNLSKYDVLLIVTKYCIQISPKCSKKAYIQE